MNIKKVKVDITPSDLVLDESSIDKKVEVFDDFVKRIIYSQMDNIYETGSFGDIKVLNHKSKNKRELNKKIFNFLENYLSFTSDLSAEGTISEYSELEIYEMITNDLTLDIKKNFIRNLENEEKLQYIVEDKLGDYTWNKDGETRDFSDTIRRIEDGSVAGIFYLDDKIIKNLVSKIEKFEKQIKKLSNSIELSVEARNELDSLQSVISKASNGNILFNKHTMKVLLSFKDKYIECDKNRLLNKIENKTLKLQDKIEKKKTAVNTYDKISVYGYENNGGELIDLVIDDSGRNQFGQKVSSNSAIAETLLSLGEIDEKNFKDLTKMFKSSFDKILVKQSKKIKKNNT